RSPEDRAQALLSLLSRYHVLELGESVVSEEEATGQGQPAVTVKSSTQDAARAQMEEDHEEAGKQQPHEEEEEAETRNPEMEWIPVKNTGKPIERSTVEEETGQGRRVDEQVDTSDTASTDAQEEQAKGDEGQPHRGGNTTSPEGGDGGDSNGRDRSPRAESDESGRRSVDGRGQPAGVARFSRLGRKDCEVAFFELVLDERNREGRLLRRFLTMAQAKKSPPPPPPPPPSSSSNPAKKTAMPWSSSGDAAGTGVKTATTLATTAAGMFSSMRRRAARGSSAAGASGGASVKVGDKKTGGAAKTASPSAGREPGSATSSSATVGKTGGVTRDSEEGDGAVGPQVVKAFINYFSKEYLVNMFDVPDFLVPTLTELVTLLVFRQARRLVFGYDRRRVTNNDKAWREKASTKTD
ncbi:unnamed protein product, partial [Ectocarpus fasciculatus]